MSTKTKRHNPDRVNSAFIPEGFRFLTKEEAEKGEMIDKFIRIWVPSEQSFAPQEYSIIVSMFTYITKK
jgi:hypothetical protein